MFALLDALRKEPCDDLPLVESIMAHFIAMQIDHKSWRRFNTRALLTSYIGKRGNNKLKLQESRGAIENALHRLKSKRCVSQSPISAFMLDAALQSEKHANKLDVFYGCLVIGLCLHYQKFKEYKRVESALTRARLLIFHSAKISDLGALYISEKGYVLVGLVNALEKFADNSPDKKMQGYAGALKLPINDLLEQELTNRRIRTKKRRENYQKRNPRNQVLNLESDDGDLASCKQYVYASSLETDEEYSTAEFDQPPETTYASVAISEKQNINTSKILSGSRSRYILSTIERREKKLITSVDLLTEHELKIVIESILGSRELSSSHRLLMALMLFTGRRFERIIEAVLRKKDTGNYECGDTILLRKTDVSWIWIPDLPKHDVKLGVFNRIVLPAKAPIRLELPQMVFGKLNGYVWIKFGEKEQKKIREYLSALNQKHKTRITLNRISDYLVSYLKRKGEDDVLSALILGNQGLSDAGVYYQHYWRSQIQPIYGRYCDHLIRISRCLSTKEEFSSKAIEGSRNGEIGGGSKLVLKKDYLKKLFAHQTTSVRRAVHDIYQFHNEYVVYSLLLLNICTGHRPVKDPYDNMNHIDIVGRKILISDKQIRSADSSRILVLPDRAIKQIQYYQEHLENIYKVIKFKTKVIKKSLSSITSGDYPLFFIFECSDKESSLGDIKRVTPKYLAQHLLPVFNLPLNWNRHYMRTYLSDIGVCGEHIDAWMGHAKPGQEAFSRFSGMSMKNMAEVALAIDRHLSDLGIEPIKGWKSQ